jgi:hypothetical protein
MVNAQTEHRSFNGAGNRQGFASLVSVLAGASGCMALDGMPWASRPYGPSSPVRMAALLAVALAAGLKPRTTKTVHSRLQLID